MEAAVIVLSTSCLLWTGDGRAVATWHKSKQGVMMLRTRERERRVGNQALGEDVKAKVEEEEEVKRDEDEGVETGLEEE